MSTPHLPLLDGTTIPALGLGTYNLVGEEGIRSMLAAIESGYELLDTALNYKNEAEVGEALRRSGRRESLQVTTKVPGRHHGYEQTLASCAESLANLGLDYVDQYLIHWPLPRQDRYVDTWRAMIELRERGIVRSIGVCNFTEEYLDRLENETGILPTINQVELHPRFAQPELRAFHASKGIVTQGWSPLARRREVFEEEAVLGVARAHGVTPSQAVLRWHVQLGVVPIPKSMDAVRQRENLDVFEFELSDTEMQSISSLESGRLWDGDPRAHEEF